MGEAIIERFNERVKVEDTVYHLGDFSLQSKYVPSILPRLNGEHHLYVGNHDRCFEAITKPHKEKQQIWVDFYKSAGFKTIELNGRMRCNDIEYDPPSSTSYKFNLSHFPYRGAGDHSDKERYWNKRLEDDGDVLLHGHVHEKWKIKETEKGTLMINVGVDAWGFYPVSIEQIVELVKSNA